MIWRLIYNWVFVPVVWIGFHIFGLFNRKARRGIEGRKNLFDHLEKDIARLDPSAKRVWFHSSSMGEFEQAKPIIAELKKRQPHVQIIVSFFSPSGYEHSKTYKYASIITYLPFDSLSNAEKFINIIRPSAAIAVRYDVWPNHLRILQQRNIPAFIANATFRSSSIKKFLPVRRFHTSMYNMLDYILTVSEQDKEMFKSFGVQHPLIDVVGDTRYDQVWQRSNESRYKHILPSAIIQNKKILVIGSSWHSDEEVLFPSFAELIASHEELLIILVPHEPTLENLEYIENTVGNNISTIRFSNLNDYHNEKIILIDSVGILMTLYRYAHVVYVGGSFGSGVHNVLEPAVYGVPVVIGPKHSNSQEAVSLVKEGAAFVGNTSSELAGLFGNLFENEEIRQRAGSVAAEFVRKHTGATGRVLSYLEKVL